MSHNNYKSSMKGDVTSAYNKSMGGQGGAKKPKAKRMSSKGKKSATSNSASIGGGT